MIVKKILNWYSPIAFNDGLNSLNSLAIRLVSGIKVNKMLDIGCGDGVLTQRFAKQIHPKEIFGIEFMDEARKLALKRGIKCLKGDLNLKWGYKSKQFDFILSSQNIEHMHDTRMYLDECYRCLKPGGKLLILTENLSSWVNIFSLLFGWQPFSTTCMNGYSLGNPLIWHLDANIDKSILVKYQKSGVSGTVGHVRVLAFRGLKEVLDATGFENIEIKTTGYLPFIGFVSRLFCNLDPVHGSFMLAIAKKPS